MKVSCGLHGLNQDRSMSRGAASNSSEVNFVISVAKAQMEPSKRLSSATAAAVRQIRNGGEVDPDYREYFRPRGGEFLTRGAALASGQLIAPDYGGAVGTPVGSARGSLSSHLDVIGVNANPGAGGQASLVVPRSSQVALGTNINTVTMSRLQAAAGKEKYGERRNPTILRKSKYDILPPDGVYIDL